MVSEDVVAVARLVATVRARWQHTEVDNLQQAMNHADRVVEAPPLHEAVGTLFFSEIPVRANHMQAASRVAVFFCLSASATFSWHAAT